MKNLFVAKTGGQFLHAFLVVIMMFSAVTLFAKKEKVMILKVIPSNQVM